MTLVQAEIFLTRQGRQKTRRLQTFSAQRRANVANRRSSLGERSDPGRSKRAKGLGKGSTRPFPPNPGWPSGLSTAVPCWNSYRDRADRFRGNPQAQVPSGRITRAASLRSAGGHSEAASSPHTYNPRPRSTPPRFEGDPNPDRPLGRTSGRCAKTVESTPIRAAYRRGNSSGSIRRRFWKSSSSVLTRTLRTV